MDRAIRSLLVVALLTPFVCTVGCGPSKEESQPNPNLKPPDIPPSSSSGGADTKAVGKKGGGLKDPAKK